MGDEGGEFVVEVRHGSLCEGIRGDANKGLDDGYKLCSAKIEKKLWLYLPTVNSCHKNSEL